MLTPGRKGAIAETAVAAHATPHLIPVALAAGRTCIHLRLAASKNSQKMSIHWAEQYELGAIAQLGERRGGTAKVVGSSPTSSTSEATAAAVASLF